jgi:hypothetical protein
MDNWYTRVGSDLSLACRSIHRGSDDEAAPAVWFVRPILNLLRQASMPSCVLEAPSTSSDDEVINVCCCWGDVDRDADLHSCRSRFRPIEVVDDNDCCDETLVAGDGGGGGGDADNGSDGSTSNSSGSASLPGSSME